MTRTARVAAGIRVILPCLLLGAFTTSAATAAPWQFQPAGGDNRPARAEVTSSDGSVLDVYRDAEGRIFLQFTANAGGGLTAASCPTFQVDTRLPLHFYTPGQACTVAGHSATYTLATLDGDRLISLVVHRLMNGERIAFRYILQDGTYHESVFSLSRSKQALLSALGRRLVVESGREE